MTHNEVLDIVNKAKDLENMIINRLFIYSKYVNGWNEVYVPRTFQLKLVKVNDTDISIQLNHTKFDHGYHQPVFGYGSEEPADPVYWSETKHKSDNIRIPIAWINMSLQELEEFFIRQAKTNKQDKIDNEKAAKIKALENELNKLKST